MIITNEQIKKYVEMVNQNAYGEVLEEIATDVGATHIGANRFSPLFRSINQIVTIEGYLKPDVHVVRTRIRDEFKAYLKEVLTVDNYLTVVRFI